MSERTEFLEEPNWRGHDPADSEHSTQHNVLDLLSKCQVRITRVELLVPFAHDSSKCYVGGTVYEVRPGDWRIENLSSKFKTSEEALYFLAESIELQRQKMLNDEFQENL